MRGRGREGGERVSRRNGIDYEVAERASAVRRTDVPRRGEGG